MLQRENRNKRHIFFLPTRSYHSSIFSLAHQKPYLPYRRYGFVLNYAPSCTRDNALSHFLQSQQTTFHANRTVSHSISQQSLQPFRRSCSQPYCKGGTRTNQECANYRVRTTHQHTNLSRYCTFPRSDYSVREIDDRKRFRTT